jgi:DNA-binding transcriptional LysR family regulator
MWQTVELRELRLFRALADELHFGRTAELLQLTPSAVSQGLRALEDKLGTQLISRTSRRVSLTPSGERLLRELGPVLGQLEGVLEQTTAAAGRLEGTLRVGIFSAPAGGPHLVEIIRAFEALHGASVVEVVQVSWDDPFARLRAGDVHVMASWLPLDQPDLVLGPVLAEQPRALAVAPDHPLATRASVDVEELAEHRLPRFDNWPRELHRAIVPTRTPQERPIRGVRVPVGERGVSDLAVRVARGEIVYPTVLSATSYMGDLTFVPMTGMPELRSALVWLRPARDPKLRAFIRVARGVLKDARRRQTSASSRASR